MPDDDNELEHGEGQTRSLWSGTITFGLLSLSVDLFPGTRSEAVPLKMVDAEHRPLVRRWYCPEHDRFLSRDEIVRGYEIADGEYVTVTNEELEGLAPEKSRAIDLRKFVDLGDIDPSFFIRSYFLTPAEEEANRAYRLLAETMERSGRAGVATFVMRGKEYLVALLAENGVLRAETLRFPDELRRPEDLGLSVEAEPAADAVQRFRREIDRLSAEELDREELRDTRAQRLRELIERKLEQGVDVERAPEAEEEAEGEAQVIDLMEVLKRRLRGEPSAQAEGAGGEADELAGRSKSELYERAKALGIPGRSAMDKDALLRALREAGG